MSTPEMKDSKGRQQTRGYSFEKVVLVILLVFFVCWIALSLMPHHHYRPHAKVVVQRAQFKSVDVAIELHNSQLGKYPPSAALDEAGVDYCGGMKLCEALMGQDLMGLHPDSVFRSDGTGGKDNMLYPETYVLSAEDYRANLEMRKDRYLPYGFDDVYALADLYGEGNTGPFEPNHFVICDVFKRVKHRRIDWKDWKVGMPILYYKADTSKTAHDMDDPNNPENIYNYKDNHALLALGVPGKPGVKHPMYEDPKIFYEITQNEKILTDSKPHRGDTYILLSAGPDGLYGTPDDIANFDWKWKRQE